MQSNRTTLTITSAVVLIAAGAWFWTSRPESNATASQPPAQIAKPVEQPRELAAVAPQAEDNAKEMRDQLLGLNKPQQERAAPKPMRRASRTRIVEDNSPTVMEEEIPGELSDRAFQSAIGNWRGVKSCLAEQQAQVKDELEGSLRVSFVISGSGDVLEAKAFDESNAQIESISDCVERQARLVKFRPFNGEDALKEAKFVF